MRHLQTLARGAALGLLSSVAAAQATPPKPVARASQAAAAAAKSLPGVSPDSATSAAQQAKQLSAEVRALPDQAANEARQRVEEVETQAKQKVAQLRNEAERKVKEVRHEAKRQAAAAVQTAIERTRVETDQFTFGIFPNSAGFMDARLHARFQYAKYLSSGLYLDYTTARAVSDDPGVRRAERLVREYRAELDALKGILLIASGSPVAWSVEPGLNGKFIHQDIDDSGYAKNSFDETVFRSSELLVDQWVTSAKLDSTLVVGKQLTFDLSGEYLPYIYQRERGTSVTSQFDDSVDYTIANRTNGYQLSADLLWQTEGAGAFRLRGKAYENRGTVASKSALVSGNFEYLFQTFQEATRQDYWVEVTHTASYIKWFGNLVPAVALAVQRKRIATADDVLEADTYKLGLLLEWL